MQKAAGEGARSTRSYCGFGASWSGDAGSDSDDGAEVGLRRGPGSAPCETGLWEVELTGAAACETLGPEVMALSGFNK